MSADGNPWQVDTRTPSDMARSRAQRLLPFRVIVFAGSVVLRARGQEHPQRRGVLRTFLVRRGIQYRVQLGAGPRRGRPVALERRWLQRLRQEERHQVPRLFGRESLVQPFRHDGDGGRGDPLDLVLVERLLLAFEVAADDELVGPGAAEDAVEDPAVGQPDRGGDVVRVQGTARFSDVAEHRVVVTVDEVRQVGPEVAPLAADPVALGAPHLLAEEDVAPPEPIPALELRDLGPGQFGPRRIPLDLGPG